jgi:hypothetical protein
MNDSRIPKDLLFGELSQGTQPTGRPQLRYKDVCKRDLKNLGKDLKIWEVLASWRSLHDGLTKHEETFVQQSTTRRQRRKTRHIASDGAATKHT